MITFSRLLLRFFKKEGQAIGRMEKAHHFSTKLLVADAIIATLVTVGFFSLTSSSHSSATTARLINLGAIELTSPQLVQHIKADGYKGNVYWLGPKNGFNCTVNEAVWGTYWIEYHKTQATAPEDPLSGVRIRTFANADFFAAHLQPLQASLLLGLTTPKGRHAAYDGQKLDEVVVHFPDERAVVEVYFASKQTPQSLIETADSLVHF